MSLLFTPKHSGYPDDYLLARVWARNAALAGVGTGRPESPKAVSVSSMQWSHPLMRREFAWLHRQLSRGLRRSLAPVFFFFQGRLIPDCLRLLASADPAGCREILEQSLLAESIVNILLADDGVEEAVARLARHLAAEYPPFGEIQNGYDRAGLQGFEEVLQQQMLHFGRDSAENNPALTIFFKALIDQRNLMLALKYKQWQLPILPELMDGGGIPRARIAAQYETGGTGALRGMIAAGGKPIPETVAAADLFLRRELLRILRRLARSGDLFAVIIEYLWKLSCAARNWGVLTHGRKMNETILAGEMI